MDSRSARPLPRLRWLLAPLALLSLTGCFDLLQELWILPDGSGRVVFDVGLPKSFLDLARARGKDPLEEMRAEARATEEDLKKDPDVTKFEFREYEQDGQQHLVYDLTVKDATRLGELQKRAMDRSTTAKQGKAEFAFRIERRGLGEYVFVQQFGEPKEQPGTPNGTKNPAEQAARDFGTQMARALLGNHYYIVRVHGQSIPETNGTLNEKKDTVEWKYNLVDLANETSKGTELRAVVQAGPPLWLWPVVIGVPLLVLALAVMAARRQRARRAI
ncbi:hypothetical protein [Vitiosangium sp. GDMCC 1.1324]|uniref:hypothetical protein n=1 Tax=Vitiosangium sp. (strain GDMCC 1.1324) TaxID=2138576 RepID=UPI000D351AD3|nr:hypothetical protein [Vitiosangium sp. GDMCC 1.1324]PTL79887.1 hypothetical protein DAT35_31125 [Vitiosangium sp. GDMCC 1.1324]